MISKDVDNILKNDAMYALKKKFRELVKENCNILYPLGIHKNVLYVAVPNSMVKNVWDIRLKRYKVTLQKSSVDRFEDIQCIVRPQHFNSVKYFDKKIEKAAVKTVQTSLNIEKVTESFIKQGMSPEMAEKCAGIQAVIDKKYKPGLDTEEK